VDAGQLTYQLRCWCKVYTWITPDAAGELDFVHDGCGSEGRIKLDGWRELHESKEAKKKRKAEEQVERDRMPLL
jgi:hypothetical protein